MWVGSHGSSSDTPGRLPTPFPKAQQRGALTSRGGLDWGLGSRKYLGRAAAGRCTWPLPGTRSWTAHPPGARS